MRLDEKLLGDYQQSFELMPKLGFNEISLWGFYVSRSWPVDVRSAVLEVPYGMASHSFF
jgi:hypothetical protein